MSKTDEYTQDKWVLDGNYVPEMLVLLQKARLSLAYNNAHSAVKTGDDIEALLQTIKNTEIE